MYCRRYALRNAASTVRDSASPDRAAARRREVPCVGFGLHLRNAVHRSDQFDELVDGPVALRRCHFAVVAHPLELIENRVLALLFPVKEEHVLEPLGELGIAIDALEIVSRVSTENQPA